MVWLNGEFVSEKNAKVSVFDHGFLMGDGVYETIKVTKGKVEFFREHLSRLKRSAQMLSLDMPYGFLTIQKAVNDLVKKNGGSDLRVRMTLTRGGNGDPRRISVPTFCIIAFPLVPEPVEIFERGVEVMTVPWMRLLPEVKSTSLLPMILGKQLVAQKNIYEVIFMDEKKYLKEGGVTNIFLVHGKRLVVPVDGYLDGIALGNVLKKAQKMGYQVVHKDFKVADVLKSDGMFLTNSLKGVVPVSKINGKVVPQKNSYREFL